MNNYPTFIVKEKCILTTDELDFKLYDDLFDKEVVDQIYDEDKHPLDFIIGDDYGSRSIISIEYLEEMLEMVKDSGANYVSIDFNIDHPDFTFSGYSIEPATDSEIESHFQAQKKLMEQIKQEKIRQLTLQLEKLK